LFARTSAAWRSAGRIGANQDGVERHAEGNKVEQELKLSYGFEKLYLACHNAIGSTETPQKRLASAATYNLMYLLRENLPSDEAWEKLQNIIDATTSKPAEGDEGTIEATISKMSDDDAAKWLRDTLDILSDVVEERGRLQGIAPQE
jgi:hypothetical protein